MTDPLRQELLDIFVGRATRRYGLSAINQLQHALQARGARRSRRRAARHRARLPAARCRPHDPSSRRESRRPRHRRCARGARRAWLADRFGPEVSEPVRLHVAAKRYLCAVEADYFGKLSPDSVRSLGLQGGLMSADEVEAFRRIPLHAEAVRLRRFDEMAKDPRATTPDFDHFLRHVAVCRRLSHDWPQRSRGRLAPHPAACPAHAGDRISRRRAGRFGAAGAEARIAAAQRLVQGPRRLPQASGVAGACRRDRRRLGRQPWRRGGLCRPRAGPQGRDLRADHRLAHQGGAAQELWRRRAPGRRRLCRGARRLGEARGRNRRADRAGLRGSGGVRGRGQRGAGIRRAGEVRHASGRGRRRRPDRRLRGRDRRGQKLSPSRPRARRRSTRRAAPAGRST